MANRVRYLVAYDICDKRRLRRVHKVVKAYGYPLQYSVFVCDLSKVEMARMRAELHEELKPTVDSVGFFDLGPPTTRGVTCVEYLGQHRTVPDSDAPAIW